MSIGVVVTKIMTTKSTKKDRYYMIPSMVGGDSLALPTRIWH